MRRGTGLTGVSQGIQKRVRVRRAWLLRGHVPALGAVAGMAPSPHQRDNTPMTDRIPLAIGLRLFAMLCVVGMGLLGKLAQARGAGLGEILFFRQASSIPIVAGSCASLTKSARAGSLPK